jgi:hypothetical protein
MRPTSLIGLGLGLVAAVVFASATTGPLVARFLLLFITPLPIALAGLGWGWRTAAVAGTVGTALVFVFSTPAVAAAFALTQAAPMAVLTYLALLSRPADHLGSPSADDASGAPALEWYPPGRIVIWAAVLAGLMAIGTLALLGNDLDQLRQALGDVIKQALPAALPEGQAPMQLSDVETAALADIALAILPGASALSWMSSLLFNLWLAGRITLASGQLGRPWPDLAALTYPAGTPLAFGALLLGLMITGYPGLVASAMAGGLFLAYLLLGLAIVHYTTRAQPWRPFALWALYGSLIVVNIWIWIVVAILGLAETVLHLRARSQAPPAPPLQPNS